MRLDNFLKLDVAVKTITEAVKTYDGPHVNHIPSLDHIKKVYGSTYRVTNIENGWRVESKKDKAATGSEWLPVTTPFPEKADADKFMAWLNRSEKDTKDQIDTMSKKSAVIYKQPERNAG